MKFFILTLFVTMSLASTVFAVQYDEEKQDKMYAKDLYGQAAQALSEMKCPDFSDIDSNFVFKVFQKAYGDEKWLPKFTSDVTERSFNHRVHLVPNPNPSEDIQVRGPANYFLLQNGSIQREVMVGPYSNPFQCGPIQSMEKSGAKVSKTSGTH